MPIQTHFDNFNQKIYLTNQSAGYKKAKEKDNSIFKEIKDGFKTAEYPVIESFKQGSFAVNTAINSLDGDFDIDRAIIIKAEDAPKDPVKPKELILEILKKRNFKDPKVKKPCVTADYKSTNLHIDYTVYKKDKSDYYYLAVGKIGSSEENKKWSGSDPEGLINWIDSKDEYGENSLEKRKQFKRLVRYIKRWRDIQFAEEVRGKVFSIGLSVMIKEQYKPNHVSSEINDDLIELKSVVDSMLNSIYIKLSNVEGKYRLYVKLPKKPYRDVFQHKVDGGDSEDGSDLNVGTQFRNKIINLQTKLQNAIDESDEIKQCTILNNVFGDDFEIPKKSNNKSVSTVVKASIFSSAGASGTSQGASVGL